MLLTDDGTEREDPSSLANLDTLSAEDAGNLDDRLLHRDLKSRIFGASVTVRIGRYEVLRRIGRGGMGTVYVAHDPELDRKVALKVLRADRRSGRERMLQEARSLARLAHPNVVTVHEVGVHDERVFVAMEFVEGVTLRSWLERSPSRSELYSVFAQAARGLLAAHRAGLVHRDFKPDNVLIGDDGRVRVVDFGVAKATDSLDATDRSEGLVPEAALPELTLTGQLLGTPAYMAAEQFLGEAVDGRTDVFAFCASLYEALAGRRPFAGDDASEVSRAVLEGTVPALDVPDVPEPLRELIVAGLSRDADARPASLEGLLRELEAPTSVPAKASARSIGRWTLGFAAATAGALVLGMSGFAALFVLQPSHTESDIVIVQEQSDAPDEAGASGEPPAAADQAATGQDAAFAAIVDAPDEQRRKAAAEAYIEQHDDGAPPARRAIAHSIVGNALWTASCSESFHGLCAVEIDSRAAGTHCDAAVTKTLATRPRNDAQVSEAREHLEITASLAGIDAPEDEAELQLFQDAIGRARVQLTDHDLEGFLGLSVPEDLDFVDNEKLSSEAFKLYYTQMARQGAQLIADYADVKKSKSRRWILAAAARTGLLSETPANALGNVEIPDSLDDDRAKAYCGAMEVFSKMPLRTARDAYAYCVSKADEYDIAGPDVELCRSRLEALAEAE